MMARPGDPYIGFAFRVEISPASLSGDGGPVRIGAFSEISGLSFESEVETLRVGGVISGEVMLPGPARISRLVLKRGLADRSFFWEWYRAVMRGVIERKEIAIMLMDERQATRQTWTFSDACPVKWTGPDLRAANSAVAFESIELLHRGLRP